MSARGSSNIEAQRLPSTPRAAATVPKATLLAALLLAAFLTLTLILALAPRAEAYVYWTNAGTDPRAGTIGRANLNGTGVRHNFIAGLRNPLRVAIDSTHVYWVNVPGGGLAIGRANLDGTGVDEDFIEVGADGLAVDTSHIYWTEYPGTIARANLDGTGIDETFITGLNFLAGPLVVDASHLYWSSYPRDPCCTVRPIGPDRIGRANLDGSAVEESFIEIEAGYVGLAVDATHVWWTSISSTNEADFGSIWRANVDGVGANRVVPGAEGGLLGRMGFYPCGLAVDDTHIYWSTGGAIGRANLDRTRANHELIGGAGGCGLAVDALGPPPSSHFSFGKVKKSKKQGTAKLTVKVPGPGELQLAKSKEVKGKEKGADAAGKEKLPIKPRRTVRKRLAAKGKAKVKAKVTYTPDGGEANTQTKRLTLVKRR